jgi:hypothetical protein
MSSENWEKSAAELQAEITRLEAEIAAEAMSPQEEIAYQRERSGVKGYLERPYQWIPQEGSRVSRLTAILYPSEREIPRMQSCLLSSDAQMGYLDYLAERVAWMMLQEESFQRAQQIMRHYLNQEGWSQIELPRPNGIALEWGQAVTVYNFELQEWLRGQYTGSQPDLSFPMVPVAATTEVKNLISEMTLEEWMILVATINKEYE